MFGLVACNLDEAPESEVTKEPIFNSESGLSMYANSFYSAFPSTSCIYSDNPYYFASNSVITYLTENGTSPDNTTGWNWTTLRNINYFIDHCNDKTLSESVNNNYLGIARFFRAYFYFSMMMRYGDLPWIDHALTTDDALLKAPRDKRTLIADKIKEDLDFAIANITSKKDASCNVITSSVAAALKSRFCLWEGTFRKYHTEAGLQSSANEWLEECVKASEYVKESGYSIYTAAGVDKSYRALFTATKPLSQEVIYAECFDQTLGIIHDVNKCWTSVTYQGPHCLTKSFINTYLMRDGKPFTDNTNYKTMSFTEETQNRDTRLAQTIRTPGFTRISNGATIQVATDYSYATTGYMTCKFTNDDVSLDNSNLCTNNIILFRYAETLLNYAEAKAELGTLSDDDWKNTIGVLRRRAGITGGDLDKKPTSLDPYMKSRFFSDVTDPAIMEIRRERAIELSYEGFSWSDICRWKCGNLTCKDWDGIYIPELDKPYDMNGDGTLDVCFTLNENPTKQKGVFYLYLGAKYASGKGNNYSLGEDGHTLYFMKNNKRTWNDKLYFYPIPTTAITLNQNLSQNPGW